MESNKRSDRPILFPKTRSVVVRSLVLASPYLKGGWKMAFLMSSLALLYRYSISCQIGLRVTSSAVYVFKDFIGVDIFFISASVGLLRTQRLHLGLSLIFYSFQFIFASFAPGVPRRLDLFRLPMKWNMGNSPSKWLIRRVNSQCDAAIRSTILLLMSPPPLPPSGISKRFSIQFRKNGS